MYMHVCAAGAKTGRLGAQLTSRYIQARMTECSKYICIWALFFDLYRIITYLPQPPSTLSPAYPPFPPPPTPCCMHTLGSLLTPPPPSRLHTSVIPFSAIAGEKRMQVPHLHSLYGACARNANDASEETEGGRQKSCKNARSFESGHLKVFVWYWILALGDIFRKMPLPETRVHAAAVFSLRISTYVQVL